MKFLSTIPRGLVIFLGGILIIIVLVVGYRMLFPTNGASPTGEGGGFFSALFPFGNPSAPANTPNTSNETPLTNTESGAVPVLRQISGEPVSGGWFAKGPASTSPPVIRFMDRASGHVEETPVDSLAETRVSNTTMPGMIELYPVTDTTVIARTLGAEGTVQNFFGILNATSSVQSFTVAPLRAFDRVAVDQKNGTTLTVTKVAGGARVDTAKADGSKSQTIFSSPIAGWVPLTAGGRSFLNTAPSATAVGYLYEIKSQTGGMALSKVAGGIAGFTAIVSPSGRYIASSGNGVGGFIFSILDTKTGTVTQSPLHAFALKCAWVPNAEPLLFCAIPQTPPQASYPEDWFIGNVSFTDEAWIIDPVQNTSYFIGLLSDREGSPIDAERISVDPSGSYALFMNKKDLSLWSLKIASVIARVQGR